MPIDKESIINPIPISPPCPDHPIVEWQADPDAYMVPLQRGLFTVIDKSDVSLIVGWKFSAKLSDHNGLWSVQGWRGSRVDGTYEVKYLHTIISGYVTTDHHDGNGLNNRRSNLRNSSSSQNKANQPLNSRNTSGYKGVCKYRNKWRAQIEVNDHNEYLGEYAVKIAAAQIYDRRAREVFGEFACLNFPNVGERSARTGKIVKSK